MKQADKSSHLSALVRCNLAQFCWVSPRKTTSKKRDREQKSHVSQEIPEFGVLLPRCGTRSRCLLAIQQTCSGIMGSVSISRQFDNELNTCGGSAVPGSSTVLRPIISIRTVEGLARTRPMLFGEAESKVPA